MKLLEFLELLELPELLELLELRDPHSKGFFDLSLFLFRLLSFCSFVTSYSWSISSSVASASSALAAIAAAAAINSVPPPYNSCIQKHVVILA